MVYLFLDFFSQNHTKNTVHRLLSPRKQQRPGCLREPHVQHQCQGRGGQGRQIWSESKHRLHHGLRTDSPHLNWMTQISNGTTIGTRLRRGGGDKPSASSHNTVYTTIPKKTFSPSLGTLPPRAEGKLSTRNQNSAPVPLPFLTNRDLSPQMKCPLPLTDATQPV